MSELTARDVLMRTRRLFTSGRWTRGTMVCSQLVDEQLVDVYCLVGGLRQTSDFYTRHSNGAYRQATDLLAEVIMKAEVLPANSKNILINFNDSRDNVGEVIEVIDKAVARLDSQPPDVSGVK